MLLERRVAIAALAVHHYVVRHADAKSPGVSWKVLHTIFNYASARLNLNLGVNPSVLGFVLNGHVIVPLQDTVVARHEEAVRRDAEAVRLLALLERWMRHKLPTQLETLRW